MTLLSPLRVLSEFLQWRYCLAVLVVLYPVLKLQVTELGRGLEHQAGFLGWNVGTSQRPQFQTLIFQFHYLLRCICHT